MDIIKQINNWTNAKLKERMLVKFGGIQGCPWCSQIVQSTDGWSMKVWDRDSDITKITCGPCGGTSLWRWEFGMMFIGPLDPPKSKYEAVPYYDIANAKQIT
jgi:hypothetical protein